MRPRFGPYPSTINQLDPITDVKQRADFDTELAYALAKGIPEGQRNVFLTRVAGYYFAQGKDYEDGLGRVNSVNQMACQPEPLGFAEVQAIVKSIYQRDQKQREQRAILDALQASEISLLAPEDRLAHAKSAWAELGVEGVFDWYKNISVGGGVQYVLELTDRSCELGESILNSAAVRDKVLNYLDVLLPRSTAAAWDKVAGRLAHLAREERTGAMRISERVDDWMDEYLATAQDVEPMLRGEALRKGAIIADGSYLLRIANFQFVVEHRFSEKLNVKQLSNMLKQAQWEPAQVRLGTATSATRVWRKSVPHKA